MLHHGAESLSPQAIAEYTQASRKLTDEIACGMRAIAENRITEFRASLARQQVCAAALQPAAELVQSLCDRDDSQAAPEIVEAMAEARKDLLRVMRAYEELVKRGRRSTSLLVALCCSYTGQYSSGFRSLRGRLYLSCEA